MATFIPNQGVGAIPGLSGTNPRDEFLQKLMTGQLFGGVSPVSQAPRVAGSSPPTGFNQRLLGALQSPGFQFGLNLLANSGPSLQPVGFGQAVGRAGQQTIQQQSAQRLQELQERLIQARMQPPQNTSGNVQSQFITDEGKLGFLRRDGTPVVTNINVRDSFSIETLPDNSKVAVNKSNPEQTIPVVSSEAAQQATVQGAVAEREAEQTAAAPETLQAASARANEISDIKSSVNDLLSEVGITTTGPLGAVLRFAPGSDARDFFAQKERIVSFLSLDKINELKAQSATGATGLGAVNEREFDALSNSVTNLDQAQSPSQFSQALRDLLARLSRIENTVERDIRAAQRRTNQSSDGGFRIVE